MFSKFNKHWQKVRKLTALKSTITLISLRAYLGKLLRMLWIRSLPVIRFPTDICAERFSTNSRLLAKNKTVTCTMRNNEHTFQAFSVTISTYANKLMSTNSIQVVIIRKTLVYTRTRSVLKRVTISYKIMPFSDVTNHCNEKSLFCEFQSRLINLEFNVGLINDHIENKTCTFLIRSITQFNTATINSARRFFTARDLAQA